MENLCDLRAIANGADACMVECVGANAVLQLMDEGANIQAIKLQCGDLMKSAKKNMKDAAAAKKRGDTKAAKKSYDDAIADLKQLQKDADKIDDDHIIMVMFDSFIKTFIPVLASFYLSVITGSSLIYIIGMLGAYICGTSKSLDFSAAVQKKLTQANHQGIGNKTDQATWWKVGETRGAVMLKFDRMITACEKAKAEL